MAVLDYIYTYEDIRGLLGVGDVELQDTRIELMIYEMSVRSALNGIEANLATTFTTKPANVIEMVKTYATRKVAYDLFHSLPLFAPKQITDSKASITRQTSDYESLGQSLAAGLRAATDELTEELNPGAVTPTQNAVGNLALISQGPNPVTYGDVPPIGQGATPMRRWP